MKSIEECQKEIHRLQIKLNKKEKLLEKYKFDKKYSNLKYDINVILRDKETSPQEKLNLIYSITHI